MGKVTALVSAYYAEDYLPQRLENLLNQVPAPEVIVVCQQGSAEAHIVKDYPVRVIVTPDIPTISAAWNMAIRAASGDYCVVANTDDTFHPGALGKMARILDAHSDIGYVFCDDELIVNGEIQRRTDRTRTGQSGRLKHAARLLSARYFCGSTPMWRKSLHATYGYFDEALVVAADYDCALRLARGNVGIWYIPESVGYYPIRPDSLEHRNQERCRTESRMIRGLI